jgi:putative transposase
MEGSIRLSASERKAVLSVYRGAGDARVTRRAHVLLLLDRDWSYRDIMAALFCSSDLVATVKQRFLTAGIEAALAEPDVERAIPDWKVAVVGWVQHATPRDFGFFRSRWSCELLARVLEEQQGVELGGEAVRRALHELGFAWRRPRPVVGLADPEYDAKLGRIKRLLETLPEDEVAVFQDEVDVHLNPKIGCAWMPVGEQATVETPGNNVKRHVAGSLVWRTGTLLVSPPAKRRNAELFLAHLDDLRRRLRGYRRIHVICDNASFHDCRRVREYLQQWGHRIQLHFLPKYAPETNPIERVWWHLHDTITRNHRCRSIEELLGEAYHWFETNNNHFLDMRHTFALAA